MAAASGTLIALAMFFAAIAAGICFPQLVDSFLAVRRRARMRARLSDGSDVREVDTASMRLLAHVGEFIAGISSRPLRRLLQVVASLPVSRRFALTLRKAGLGYPDTDATLLALGSACLGSLIALFLTRNIPVSLVAGIAAPCLISIKAAREGERRAELLRQQLPAALSSIAVSLGAGKSLQQALSYSASRAQAPLARELQLTVCEIEAGRTLDEAMVLLEQRTAIKELAFVTCALSIQQRTGGSLKEILDSASRSVCDAFDLKRTLRVQTAQTKLSARIVIGMPFLLLGAFMLISPNYLMTFFQSVAGVITFLVAIGLDVCGLVAIGRLMKVEV